MGQQVKFETLSAIAEIIQKDERIKPEGIITSIRNNKNTNNIDIPVIEMSDVEGPGSNKNIDLFEVYWAPLTEGMIKAREITAFLFQNGLKFLPSLLTSSVFKRYIFNKLQEFRITHFGTFALIAGVLSMISGIILLYLATGFVFLNKVVKFFLNAESSHPEIYSVIFQDVKSFFIPIILISAALIAAASIKKIFIRLAKMTPKRTFLSSAALSLSIIVFIVFVLVTDVKIIADLLDIHFILLDNIFRFLVNIPRLLSHLLPGLNGTAMLTLKLLFFISILGIILFLRNVYIQFLGDVVIYVSSHTLNRFEEIRSKIKDAGKQVFNYVFSLSKVQTDQTIPDQKCYDKIIVIGHSLGSVIAYDCLNGVYKKDDKIDTEYVNRTQALITFGSPLNKTAFLFRKQLNRFSELRERLALEKQPLVKEYIFRPAKWINIYSRMDIISGKLKFYDPAAEIECDPLKKVENFADPEAKTLLLAHTEYWDNKILPKLIADQIIEAFK
ncbi:hypothetical protein BH10BAC5_BH10BAC5_07850 [soil metagenome]